MSNDRPIDLRSDTVTRPSPAMRRAMAEAEVGDDVYGEDPTVRALEERTAALLGLEAGLYVASGTAGNQLAIGVHCRPGDEVIAEAGSHCFNFEGGAASALWGVQTNGLVGERGLLRPEQVVARPENDHFPRSRLLALENTHNRGGGSVWPVERFTQVVQRARAQGLKVHLDGARLFNAQAATGTKVDAWSKLTDSTTVCFSKGLGAPVGSVLCGPKSFIQDARRLRKRLGGGMRQVGILAAAALYALDHNVARLGDDHRNAKRLAEGLSGIPGVSVVAPDTNLVFVETPLDAPEAVAKLKAAGVLVNAEGSKPKMLRLVTHLDVSAEEIEQVISRVARVLKA